MEEAKIHLSAAEESLMKDASLILTKNTVQKKVRLMLQSLQEQLYNDIQSNEALRTSGLFSIPPKISRGEQYLGLPYLVLDYPRIFEGKDIFLIRTLFWWGHFFSCTLQLSGRYKAPLHAGWQQLHPVLSSGPFYIGVQEDPWVHHFEEDNYRLISEMSAEEFRTAYWKLEHMKIAARWPLQDLPLMFQPIKDTWYRLLNLGIGQLLPRR
jgi:hypothetical protein